MTITELKHSLHTSLGSVFYGTEYTTDYLVILLILGGHGLVEDVPGTGKTLLVKALAKLTGLETRRVQGTPDLAPGDILGYAQFQPSTGALEYKEGPIQTNILLIDEINRAPPRTQSALLQAMAEGSIMRMGETHQLPNPFMVLATENPVDFEGTFPLPEAQRDRFLLSFSLGYPLREQELKIMTMPEPESAIDSLKPVMGAQHILALRGQLEKIHCDTKIMHWIRDLAEGSRFDANLSLGISPRGSRALYRASLAKALLSGRTFVIPEDVKSLLVPVCRGRIVLKPGALARGMTHEQVLENLVGQVATPALREETT